MTLLLAPRVEKVIALDVCAEAVAEIGKLGLKNVETVCELVEHFSSQEPLDWIVMSEVVEHLRNPLGVLRRCVS